MIARRLLASLIAVLCIAAWMGLESSRARRSDSDEIAALAGSLADVFHSTEVEAQPRGPVPPHGFVAWLQPAVAVAASGHVEAWVSQVASRVAGMRSGDPGAPRGPPSFIVA